MVNFTAGSVLTASALNTAFNTQTIDAQTGTTFTFGTANSGELVTLSNASGGTATIPPNSTYGAATGTVIGVMNAGTAGSFVIAAGSGVTLNAVSGTTTLAPLEAATLVKLATNTWQLTKGGGLPKASYSATTGSPTVTTVSGKTCVQFTGSGSITISQAGLVEVLVVGGGGAGGCNDFAATVFYSGGGGAGGLIHNTNFYISAATHTITVGAGASGMSTNPDAALLANGGVSKLGDLVLMPGGGQGSMVTVAGYESAGYIGGSGGGGQNTAGPGMSGVGNSGGVGSRTTSGGGGGGAAAAGSVGTANTGGAGGAGSSISITGSAVTYAAGGGGAGATTGGAGGSSGVGGAGAAGSAANGGNGTVNRGAGGGGTANGTSGSGGSGIVILLFG